MTSRFARQCVKKVFSIKAGQRPYIYKAALYIHRFIVSSRFEEYFYLFFSSRY